MDLARRLFGKPGPSGLKAYLLEPRKWHGPGDVVQGKVFFDLIASKHDPFDEITATIRILSQTYTIRGTGGDRSTYTTWYSLHEESIRIWSASDTPVGSESTLTFPFSFRLPDGPVRAINTQSRKPFTDSVPLPPSLSQSYVKSLRSGASVDYFITITGKRRAFLSRKTKFNISFFYKPPPQREPFVPNPRLLLEDQFERIKDCFGAAWVDSPSKEEKIHKASIGWHKSWNLFPPVPFFPLRHSVPFYFMVDIYSPFIQPPALPDQSFPPSESAQAIPNPTYFLVNLVMNLSYTAGGMSCNSETTVATVGRGQLPSATSNVKSLSQAVVLDPSKEGHEPTSPWDLWLGPVEWDGRNPGGERKYRGMGRWKRRMNIGGVAKIQKLPPSFSCLQITMKYSLCLVLSYSDNIATATSSPLFEAKDITY